MARVEAAEARVRKVQGSGRVRGGKVKDSDSIPGIDSIWRKRSYVILLYLFMGPCGVLVAGLTCLQGMVQLRFEAHTASRKAASPGCLSERPRSLASRLQFLTHAQRARENLNS